MIRLNKQVLTGIFMIRFIAIAVFLGFPCLIFSQAEQQQLARNYADQGAYEKAIAILEKVHKIQPTRISTVSELTSYHQQLEQYAKAQELLESSIKRSPDSPMFYAELGHNYELQKEPEKAEQYYSSALEKLQLNWNYSRQLGAVFEKYNLLDQAIKVYEQTMQHNERANYYPQLARIYGEQGKLEEMFNSYLTLIHTNPIYFTRAQHTFNLYITEDATNEANSIFRKLLLRKLQQQPDILYNTMLSWLFVQQQEFSKAFSQEKAIYKRSNQGFQGIMDLATIAIEAEDTDSAIEMLQYIVDNPSTRGNTIKAHQLLQQLRIKNTNEKELASIDATYKKLLEDFGKSAETLDLQIDYANFIAFNQLEKPKAIAFLKEIPKERLSKFDVSKIKMALADILVFDEKFNEALIYYSQVQNLVKNDVLSQEARFKVAKTSYYKGDFDWAQTQLKVLKGASSQLIANDAMELSLVISDNSQEDSTQAALRKFAKAELLTYQKRYTEALDLYDNLLIVHKGEKVEDDALYKQAKLYESLKQFDKAVLNYQKIIDFYKTDILSDDAHYHLANLYSAKLNKPEEAKKLYEYIIFNKADSIHYVAARKKYRELRGDVLDKEL